MIRVLVVDDHQVVRTGLVSLLESVDGVEVVATAADGEEAVVKTAQHAPDVVLMDLSMPGVDGVEATRRITESESESRVVALTSFSDREFVLAALDAGAVGYLLKDAEPEELIRGLRAASEGHAPLDPRAAGALLEARHDQKPTVDLTAREREVLTLVAEGLANKQIARRLDISEKTVKAHLTSVFQRLGVGDRTQAALWAFEHGLVPKRA